MRSKRVLLLTVLLVAVLLGSSTTSAAGLSTSPVTRQAIATEPVTIPDTVITVMHSEITGRDYRIYVGLPAGYTTRADRPPKYPVVYSLDANWHFGIDAGSSRFLTLGGELNPVIVVGIGYPTDDNGEVMALREWDLRPGDGAEAFLAFIREELMPTIDRTYRTDKHDRTLMGHSYGGLFTLYTLFHATDAFQRYIALSPSLWYGPNYEGERAVFGYEEAYAAEYDELPVELFLSGGDSEIDFDPYLMVSNVVEFHQVLASRDYEGLELQLVIIEGLGHTGSYAGAATRGMAEVFR